MRRSSQRPDSVFLVFSYSPVSLRSFFSYVPGSLDPGEAADGFRSLAIPESPGSRGPVPGSRARTSFSLSSSRGQARGLRVASPAPWSGGGGATSGLRLRKELGEEVSLNSVNWRGYRGKGVGWARDGEAPLVLHPCLGHAGILSSP